MIELVLTVNTAKQLNPGCVIKDPANNRKLVVSEVISARRYKCIPYRPFLPLFYRYKTLIKKAMD